MSLLGLTRSLFSAVAATRSFSSTPANFAGYKLKTHTGTKKRWSAIANGMFKRGKCGKRHLNTHMPASKISALSGTVISTKTQAKHLRRLMPGT
ncbi:hypothetical protein RSAG8_04995, partial [Rhizoctonia solani AG-8 WAC10335]